MVLILCTEISAAECGVERVNISHVTALHVQHTSRVILRHIISHDQDYTRTALTLAQEIRPQNPISTSTKIKHINDTVLMLGKVKKKDLYYTIL